MLYIHRSILSFMEKFSEHLSQSWNMPNNKIDKCIVYNSLGDVPNFSNKDACTYVVDRDKNIGDFDRLLLDYKYGDIYTSDILENLYADYVRILKTPSTNCADDEIYEIGKYLIARY